MFVPHYQLPGYLETAAMHLVAARYEAEAVSYRLRRDWQALLMRARRPRSFRPEIRNRSVPAGMPLLLSGQGTAATWGGLAERIPRDRPSCCLPWPHHRQPYARAFSRRFALTTSVRDLAIAVGLATGFGPATATRTASGQVSAAEARVAAT